MSNRERIVTGQKYRILSDYANKIWDRISFWTKAVDVEFDSGSDLETYAGSVNSSLSSLSSRITTNTSNINSLSSTVSGHTSSISSLSSSVSSLSNSVNSLNSTVSSLSNTLSITDRIARNAEGGADSALRALNGFSLEKVSSLPSSPSSQVIYFIPK